MNNSTKRQLAMHWRISLVLTAFTSLGYGAFAQALNYPEKIFPAVSPPSFLQALFPME